MPPTTADAATPGSDYKPGLEGVVAAETRLSRVNGELGELILAGYPVGTLAPEYSFEQVVFLFLEGRHATDAELAAWTRTMASWRAVPAPTLALIESAAARGVGTMELLRMGVASLSVSRDLGLSQEQEGASPAEVARAAALPLLAVFPTLVAAGGRAARGEEIVAPRSDLGHAANYLYMLTGEEPASERVRALETYLNTVVDHGMNASTFAARVVISTHSDLVSALVGAIGALKGPLHGGAPGPVLDMIREIADSGDPQTWIEHRLDAGERLMGFGHRVYRVRDPRAEVLAAATALLMSQSDGASHAARVVQTARSVEECAVRILRERKPHLRLAANVEFGTAVLLHAIGLPKELFTATFAIARSAGWTAHAIEQLERGRLMRPRGHYDGPLYAEEGSCFD